MTLSNLTYKDLMQHNSWKVIVETIDDEDVGLEPAIKDKNGLIDFDNGAVWCLCKAHFANGEKHLACAMCRSDDSDGPVLWSVWNGKMDVTLIIPPAPSFVLDEEGPESFCINFNRKSAEVFPIYFEVIPKFQIEPSNRSITIEIL